MPSPCLAGCSLNAGVRKHGLPAAAPGAQAEGPDWLHMSISKQGGCGLSCPEGQLAFECLNPSPEVQKKKYAFKRKSSKIISRFKIK